MMKYCMIVNPPAGKKQGMAAAEAASNKLKEHGISNFEDSLKIILSGQIKEVDLGEFAYSKGEHVTDNAVEVITGKTISLESDRPLSLTPDGETFGETPIDVTMHPKKIKMFC